MVAHLNVSIGTAKNNVAFTPTLVSYTTGSAATETAPAGCSNVVIEIWGSGGAGGVKTGTGCGLIAGDGGGATGYSRTSVAITGGQTLTYTVGQPSSIASSASSGTKTITTMTANGGAVGGNGGAGPGAGGTASGGTAVNTTGATGNVGNAAAPAAPLGVNANVAGANGKGGIGSLTVSQNPGIVGMVAFYYT